MRRMGKGRKSGKSMKRGKGKGMVETTMTTPFNKMGRSKGRKKSR